MKIKVTASTRFVGSKDSKVITVDDEDLEDMSETERTIYLDDFAREVLWDIIEWGWEEA